MVNLKILMCRSHAIRVRKIAESGTHEQLMAQNKAYAALFNKQQELEHFREEAV